MKDMDRNLLEHVEPERYGGATQAALEQIRLADAGFDFSGICMLPDCGCDGDEHEM